MKLDAAQTNKLTALLNRVRKKYKPNAEAPPEREPIATLIVAFLAWEASSDDAEDALGRIMADVTDFNELRVTYDFELVSLIGADYPMVNERVTRLRQSLNAIYKRERAVEMLSIRDKTKKDQKHYLDTLPGAPPYVIAQTFMHAFGGYAMPVDRRLMHLICAELKLDPLDTDPTQTEAALLKLVKAAEAPETHLALQAWSNEQGDTPPELPDPNAGVTPAVPPAAPKPASAKQTKKPTKKAAASKATKTTKAAPKKKPAAKKPTAKKAPAKKKK